MENIKTWYEDKSDGRKNWDIHLGSNLHLRFSILLVLIYLLTEIVSNFENTNYISVFSQQTWAECLLWPGTLRGSGADQL